MGLETAIKWDRPNKIVQLSQSALIDKITLLFGQADASPVPTPMNPRLRLQRVTHSSLSPDEQNTLTRIPYCSLVGCSLYLTVGTRPDISYAVQQLSQFLDSYSHLHWHATIHVVPYLKGTKDLSLNLGGNHLTLLGFIQTRPTP